MNSDDAPFFILMGTAVVVFALFMWAQAVSINSWREAEVTRIQRQIETAQ